MSSQTLGLTIPEQLTAASPESGVSAIQTWITQLELANPVLSSQELIEKLVSLNATTLNPEERFELLELFQASINTNYEQLKKRYTGQTQPLSSEKIAIINLSQNIHMEILTGYKIIVENIESNSTFFNKNSISHHAVYRCFKHFNKILDSCYHSYTECRENIWREMHILYNYAIDSGVADKSISLDQYPIPINTLTPYKQALFLASASPYEWRQQDQQAIYNIGMLQHELIIIRKFKEQDLQEKTAKFFIPVNEDVPVHSLHLNSSCYSDDGYILDLTKLLKYIQELLKNSSLTQVLPTRPGLASYSIAKLIKRINNNNYRKSDRFAITGKVFLASGFAATHYHVNQNRTFNPETVGSEQDNNTESLELGTSLLEDAGQDMEKNFRIDKALYKCKLLNIHAEGAGICVEDMLYPPIQPVEIVAISIVVDDTASLDQTRWNIGIIKWLKCNRQQQLMIGIEIFAPFAMAAAVQLLKEGNPISYYQRAFIFNNVTNKKYNLITPTIKIEANQSVKIYSFHHKKFITTRLGAEIMNNNNFKCFTLDVDFS